MVLKIIMYSLWSLKMQKNSKKFALKRVVIVIRGISEASYGQTNADWTFLNHSLRRSIFDLAIPLDSLVQLPPTIWLTAAKHESLNFFQRNKDHRAFIGKF